MNKNTDSLSCQSSCWQISRIRYSSISKEWKPGARLGAQSLMGLFGGRTKLKRNARAPPNDIIIVRARNVAPGFYSF